MNAQNRGPSPFRGVPQRSYWAFISYRHADNREEGRRWATWLHEAIENYEIPPELVGLKTRSDEAVPERIFPVFRDEEELPADADLSSPIYSALDHSKYLIVLCSPRAVESLYVANEVAYFKKLGRADRILAVIIDGEPNASWDAGRRAAGFAATDECFPEPMRHEVDEQGRVLSEKHAEPVAADTRILDEGRPRQGWTNSEAYRLELAARGGLGSKEIDARTERYAHQLERAKLKVVAGILGIQLGELTKRDRAHQLQIERTRARRLRRWLGAVAVLALLAAAGGGVAWKERTKAVRSEQLAEASRQEAVANQQQAEESERRAEASRQEAVEKEQLALASRQEAVESRQAAVEALSEMLLDRSLAFKAEQETAKSLALGAAAWSQWPGNEVAGDLLLRDLSIHAWLLPQRRFPAPPGGTSIQTAQEVAADFWDEMLNTGVRKPWAGFDPAGGNLFFLTPVEDDLSSVRVSSLAPAPGAKWADLGVKPAPNDGRSFEGRRLATISEGEDFSGDLYLVDSSGGQEVLKLRNGRGEYGRTIGHAAFSGDGRRLGFIGWVEEEGGSFRSFGIRSHPRVQLVDTSTWENIGDVMLPAKAPGELYQIKLFDRYMVAQYVSPGSRNWYTQVFQLDHDGRIRIEVSNQMLPGVIDDFSPDTGEFLVRSESDLATYRLICPEGILRGWSSGMVAHEMSRGVVDPNVRAWNPDHGILSGAAGSFRTDFVEVDSPAKEYRARFWNSGRIEVFETAAPEQPMTSFYVETDIISEGGRFISRVFFVPNSPYLCVRFAYHSDGGTFWECWDFKRGRKLIGPEHIPGTSLIGCSPDGRLLAFSSRGDVPEAEGAWSPGKEAVSGLTEYRLRYPSTGDVAVAGRLAALCGGMQWTGSGFGPLDSAGAFRLREQVLDHPVEEGEFGEWLSPWLELLQR